MNVFSAPEFLEALAGAFHPGRPAAAGDVEVDGRRYRLLVVDGRQVVTTSPLLDFVEPLPPEAGAPAPAAAAAIAPAGSATYIPRVSHARVAADVWLGLGREARRGLRPSPLIDWSRFREWSDFVRHVAGRARHLAGDSRRKRRRLERDVGPVLFTLDDGDGEALDLALQWKSAWYRRRRVRDIFRSAANVQVLRGLARRGALAVSTLRAGGRIVSVHLGLVRDGRRYWWIPTYDAAFGAYSPGRLLLEALLRASQERGERELDLLLGGEAYKWAYATDVRIVGAAGRPPRGAALLRALKDGLKGVLSRLPSVR